MNQKDIATLLNDKIQTVRGVQSSTILVGPIKLPVNLEGETVVFQWYCWLPVRDEEDRQDLLNATAETIVKRLSTLDLAEGQQSSVLVYGDLQQSENALVRMHSICHTGDIFGSKRCDCGFQLHQSMKMIVEHGTGALFYLANHEGRGIGLFSKAMAYILQEEGMDTVEANHQLGFEDDTRNYADAISVLRHLRQKPVTLITNNPKKMDALKKSGMNVAGRMPLWGDVSQYNERYLNTKVERSGHLRDSDLREVL
ncbi:MULTISPECIES: GTP cyclohydrolase II [Paenibacillus]|uniref:GTP cyclohydrolase II n=2 Tax=Paenibacillus TaxID=44249 RepID=A0A7H0Y730_9BACL|nr:MULTISPECIES: GTP cyclohydrolase II [Paenibacillus]PNQ80984.1 GTP cyclohydrolase [Paenibacillus sp. F4]QNR66888.1 GTP cyclohydrolase II [Paenibacillus peoriae]